MRDSTQADYIKRIDRIVAYIEARNLENGAPALDELAGIAAMSPHHFHRVYRLMTGETIGDTVRRLRLARTLPNLMKSAVSVTEAAAASGYASSQAYARAIRTLASRSATDLRDSSEVAAEIAAMLGGGAKGAPLSIEVVSTEPFRVTAIRNVGDYANLNEGFDRLVSLVFAQQPSDALIGVHGIPVDDPRFTDAAAFRFECALHLDMQVLPSPELSLISIAGGPHVRCRHVGAYDKLFDTVDFVYAIILAQDLALGRAPMRIHYIDTPGDAPADQLRSDVYIPLENADQESTAIH